MKTKSVKAKGRRLQDWVRNKLIKLAPNLLPEDVRCAIMGESGEDIKLSTKARRYFPFKIECKNVERLNIWEAYNQAISHDGIGEPLLIISKNRRTPLAIIDAEYLLTEFYNAKRKTRNKGRDNKVNDAG